MSQTATRDEFDVVTGQISRAVSFIWKHQFGDFSPSQCWSPAVNVYRLQRRLEVCVDLAGVDPAAIEVRVEAGRMVIRGQRSAPEPPHTENQSMRILAMEIDHGSFSREIALPADVELRQVTSEYHHGLLWVRLPLRVPG